MEHTRSRPRLGSKAVSAGAVGGFSLAEVLIVVAFLAIVAAISVPNIARLVTDSKYETAKRNLNYLNGAVIGFNGANWELVLAASSGSSDEQAIFNSLRYRGTTNPSPGSPYLPSTAAFAATSDTATYRAMWNGRMFVIVVPGSNGTGLDLMKIMGSSVQTAPTNTPVPRSP
jgi:type II secretory pathway pseudopilin PulG